MRRSILISLILVSLLLSDTALIYASEKEFYTLDELGLTISIPNKFAVFTRDTPEDDPKFALCGITKESLDDVMVSENIYLTAFDQYNNKEIVVTKGDSIFPDFSGLSDSDLSACTAEIKSLYLESGITFQNSDIYSNGQIKFMRIFSYQSNSDPSIYAVQYFTVHNKQAINITLRSLRRKATREDEMLIKEVVDNAQFEENQDFMNDSSDDVFAEARMKAQEHDRLMGVTAQKTTGTSNGEFIYEDKDSGLSFTVPKDWKETEFSKPRQYIDTKFESNLEQGLSIVYGSNDIYGDKDFKKSLIESGFAKAIRGDIDNSFITKSDIASMFDCVEQDISMVNYGGKEYFCAKIMSNQSVQGIELSLPVILLIRIENGYMYLFEINAHEQHPYFGDFVDMVSSAVYPPRLSTSSASLQPITNQETLQENSNTLNAAPDSRKAPKISTMSLASIIGILLWALIPGFIARKKGRSFFAYYFLSLVITPLLTMIITLCLKNLNSTQTSNTISTYAKTNSVPDSAGLSQSTAQAENLRNPLMSDSNLKEGKKEISLGARMTGPVITPDRKIQYCRRCGFKLVDDSGYCSRCGTEIEKEEEHQ